MKRPSKKTPRKKRTTKRMQLAIGQTNFAATRYPATITGFDDLGAVNTPNGKKMLCRLVYTLDALDEQGRQKRISETLNQSLSDKATLYARILVILGGEVPALLIPSAVIGKRVVVLVRTVADQAGKTREVICGLEAPEPGPPPCVEQGAP